MSEEEKARAECIAAGQTPDDLVSGCRYDNRMPGIKLTRCKSTGFINDVARPRWHFYLNEEQRAVLA